MNKSKQMLSLRRRSVGRHFNHWSPNFRVSFLYCTYMPSFILLGSYRLRIQQGSRRVKWQRADKKTYLASSVRAQMPAASGADADVPVWSSVHWSWMSVVSCVNHITNHHIITDTYTLSQLSLSVFSRLVISKVVMLTIRPRSARLDQDQDLS